MDIIHQHALSALHLYQTSSPYLTPIRNALSTIQSRTLPVLLPLLDRAATWAADSPGIVMVALLLVLLFVARIVLAWIWRTVLFWLRIAFWATVVLVLALVWQRGFDRTAQDLGRWAEELGRFWWEEYERFEKLQKGPEGARRR